MNNPDTMRELFIKYAPTKNEAMRVYNLVKHTELDVWSLHDIFSLKGIGRKSAELIMKVACDLYGFKEDPRAPSHRPVWPWVSVKDHLPEENGKYVCFIHHHAVILGDELVVTAFGEQCVLSFYNGRFYNIDGEVTYWAPLLKDPEVYDEYS